MHTYLFHVPIKYIKLTAKRNERERERKRKREKREEGKREGKKEGERGGRKFILYSINILYQISLMENHLYRYKILLFICIFLLFNKLITIMNF